MSGIAQIILKVFDGACRLIAPAVKLPVILRNGRQNQVRHSHHFGLLIEFAVVFFNNFGNNYAVLLFANKHLKAGLLFVKVTPTAPQVVGNTSTRAYEKVKEAAYVRL